MDPRLAQPRITLREAAGRLGVSIWTLRRWAHGGLINHYLIGSGHYMWFDPRDVEALALSWERRQRTPPVE